MREYPCPPSAALRSHIAMNPNKWCISVGALPPFNSQQTNLQMQTHARLFFPFHFSFWKDEEY